MKKKILLLLPCFLIIIFNIYSQNVGIGTSSPAEKLDVNGNINVSGTIKANGTGGQANQVLMTNSIGNLAWGDMCQFKNMITFVTVGSFTWTIPSGVTRIWVEAWGGGGGANGNGGGGGGGYASAIFTVTPTGSVSYTVGGGGSGGNPGITGGNSNISFGTFLIIASGGAGENSATTFAVAPGGSFSASVATGYYGCVGEAGSQNKFEGYQLNSTTYRENQSAGKGGDGGNSIHTGGKGSYHLRDGVSSGVIYAAQGSNGQMPGGGGGGSGIWGGSLRSGGQGMVIIHY